MKKIYLVIILLWSAIANAATMTTCTNNDLKGEWIFKYTVKNPSEVGTLDWSFHDDLSVTGRAQSITLDTQSDVFDGNATISNKCAVKGTVTFDTAAIATLNLMLVPSTKKISGSITVKIDGKSRVATVTATRIGSAVCSTDSSATSQIHFTRQLN